MDKILERLSASIEELESQSLVVRLKVTSDRAIEMVETLAEGKFLLRRARMTLRRAAYLIQKGYGKLEGPEEG